jgi:hypothetical protein
MCAMYYVVGLGCAASHACYCLWFSVAVLCTTLWICVLLLHDLRWCLYACCANCAWLIAVTVRQLCAVNNWITVALCGWLLMPTRTAPCVSVAFFTS